MKTLQCSWIPVAPSKSTKKKHGQGSKPKPVKIHGQDYALYWSDDIPCLVKDQCSHRGASLSLGTVSEKGCVRCGYHGRPTRSLPSNRILDHNGIIWWRDDTPSGIDAPVPESWEFVSQRVFTYEEDFDGCNPLLMTENTIDFAHLSHVHAFSFTKGEPRVEIDHDARTAQYIYDTTIDLVLRVENQFWAPWTTCLRFYLNDRHAFSLHFAWIPRDFQSTGLIVRVTRSHDWTALLGDQILRLSNTLPLMEDRDIVRSINQHRRWSDDKLNKDDAFVKLYRDTIIQDHPHLLNLYMDHHL